MKHTSKFMVALVIGSLIAGWLIATLVKPSKLAAAAVDPSQSIGRYQFISQGGLYVFDTTEGKLYQFSMDAQGAPNWKKMGSPADAK